MGVLCESYVHKSRESVTSALRSSVFVPLSNIDFAASIAFSGRVYVIDIASVASGAQTGDTKSRGAEVSVFD